MGINFEVKLVTQEVEEFKSFTCNKCGQEYDDPMEVQEIFHWHGTGGYGSVFGDGNNIEVVLCQYCTKDVLGAYVEECNRAYTNI